ncbi:membrane protein YczE [Embleya hyalina]|uniref:Membrane protein n=1 Tax=Embleya hyalina TaxID=516124 RepID=A0A401YUC4_9ACTN|nr:membrane protein [Embleya hyalina]
MAWSWVRRLVQLYAGLTLYGFSMALMIRAELGLDPWDVFHQGLAERTGWSFGVVTIVVGAAVLLLWLPMRQRPGLGTVSNVVVIGLAVDASLRWLPSPDAWAWRVAFLVSGVVLNAVAGGAYIGARLGPGPRDGLMTGMVRRTGRSVRLIRTSIEVAVLAVGFVLGGSVGLGTVLYALTIGPLVQVFLPLLTVPERTTDRAVAAGGSGSAEPAERTPGSSGTPAPTPAG